MTNEPEPPDVKNIWQNQSVEGTAMSLEEIKKNFGQLQKKMRQRRVVRGLAVLFVAVLFAGLLFKAGNLMEGIGAALVVIGTGYVGYQLLLIRKKPASVLWENEPLASAMFYRIELERERDFHRGLWLWSRIVVVVPGALVFLIGRIIEHPEGIHPIRLAASGVFLVLIVARNLRLARKYQREIDALDAVKQ
jgi:uncharacterized membrane protein YjjP (DUF1212 family)